MFSHVKAYLLTAAGLVAGGMPAAPFEPAVDFSLTEKWRWHELEPLGEHLLLQGVEDAEGNLIFTGEDDLLVYDGYSINHIPYPVDDPALETYQLFQSQNGYLYLHTNRGVWGLRAGVWQLALEHNESYNNLRNRFVRNGHGHEMLALRSGLYRIHSDGFSRYDDFDAVFNAVAFDNQNRLWFSTDANDSVSRLQFSPEGPDPTSEIQQFPFHMGLTGRLWLVASPSSSEVWVTNWQSENPPLRFDETSATWEIHDLRHLSGGNGHSAAFALAGDDVAFASKTAIMVRSRENWHVIDYPQFDFPTNNPFAILRANGRLVIGGRGEKVYEIDYQSSRQDSYHGLHFQCDIGGINRWFLSIDGRIIEQNTVYDTWTHHEENVIDTPLVIIASDDGTIWAAGAHQETAAVCHYNGRTWTRETFPLLNSFISHLSARHLPDGSIFFGSGHDNILSPDGGAVIYRRRPGGYQAEYLAPPLVPSRPVGVTVDAAGDLWFGGLTFGYTAGDLQSDYVVAEEFTDEIWIDHVASDHDGHVWLALWERGLYSNVTGEWIPHRGPQQIASSQVSFILRDEFRPGNLWFATDRGISRFDGKRWYAEAMPPELRFNRESGTLTQSSDGAIWVNVGTRNWFFRKHPGFYLTKRLHDTFKTVRYQLEDAPPVVSIDTDIPRSTAPANVFITWTGRDKWSTTPAERLKYSHRLNAEPWSEFAEGNTRALLDLPAGRHTFEVRALDRDGNLSITSSRASLVVVPPVWQRPWFAALILLTLITIALLVYLLFRQRIRHIIQIEEFKLQFFTNISHELRTPLTVILGPLESQLAKLPPGWDKRPLEIAYKSAQRTLALIDQILDFRRAETGKIKVNLARSDLAASVRETFHLLRPLAEDRNQRIELLNGPRECVAWYDAEIIEKILNNLISNAVKYTPKGGQISVFFKTTELNNVVTAEFVVEDNGIGIPLGKIDDIFEVFYRAGNAPHKKVRGSGIGLAYTKNLVEACEGKITVDSPVAIVNGRKQGTRFTVTLPLKKHLEGHENDPVVNPLTTPEPAGEADRHEDSLDPGDSRPLILVVEDDDEIRSFLASELQENYLALEAANGAVALQIAQRRIPDLVITDVMMPEIDGKELCRRLKTDESTSHIPIVMLTALKSEMHELEGLEIGADDYLTKPVRLSILKQRVRNLLESRQKLHERFNQQKESATVVAREITTNPVDEAFMEKAVTIVEEQLEDPLFDVEAFADRMFMSRMTLYRKMKAITGDSPSAFIRSIRMNKAAALLATGEHNVSETADLVGLTDLSSFSTAFKKHFKVSPSQYTRRNHS